MNTIAYFTSPGLKLSMVILEHFHSEDPISMIWRVIPLHLMTIITKAYLTTIKHILFRSLEIDK